MSKDFAKNMVGAGGWSMEVDHAKQAEHSNTGGMVNATQLGDSVVSAKHTEKFSSKLKSFFEGVGSFILSSLKGAGEGLLMIATALLAVNIFC